MSTIRTNTLSNVAGTQSTAIENAINGSAKAWVNFNGQGTVAIRASYNVSSITDLGTGTYYVNFSTAMPNTNYCVTSTRNWRGVLNPDEWNVGSVLMIGADTINNSPTDAGNNFVVIHR